MYLFLGLGIGILSGFFGIGGGFILTPFLILISFSPVVAIATSLLYTIGTSFSGSIAHARLNHIKWKIGFLVGFTGIIATQLAHPFVLLLEKYHIAEILVPVFYILLITYFSLSLLRKDTGCLSTKPTTASGEKYKIAKILFIGLFAGFISSTIGVGGGFIIVPLLIGMMSFTPKHAVGTSLLSVLLIVAAGFSSYAPDTPMNVTINGSLIIGALIGGQLGALLTPLFTEEKIRIFLACLYIATGVSLLSKLFHFDKIGLFILLLYCVFLLFHLAIHALCTKWKLKSKQTSS